MAIKTKKVHVAQHDEKDCGAACLSMIAGYYGLKLPIARYRELIQVDNQGANIYGITTGAKQIGFDTDALEGSFEELEAGILEQEIKCPFIARIVNAEGYEHFITVFDYDVLDSKVTIGDPAMTKVIKISAEEFEECWQGQIIIFQPNVDFKAVNESKGVLSRFFQYIFNQKKMLACIFVISLIISCINMFGSVVFQYVLNDATSVSETSLSDEDSMEPESEHEHSHENESFYEKAMEKLAIIFDNLNVVCITIIGLYLLKCFINILRSYMLALTSKNVNVPLVTNFYNHMLDLPFKFFGTRKSGELISRFQNAAEIKDAVSSATLTVMLDTLMAVVFGVVLFLISKTLFLITVIALIIYSVLMFLFKNPIRQVNHEIMEQDAQVTSYLKETIDGINTIKANRYDKIAKNKLKKLVISKEDKCVKGSVIGGIQGSIVELISSAFVVVLLWAGAYLCVENAITVGALFTFYYMIDYFLSPVSNLINLQPMLQTAIAAAERLNDILDAEIETNTGDKSFQNGDIQIKNLKFCYGNREDVLKGIDLFVRKGQKIAVIGESGCGKTTLAKLIMRFYEPADGSITINDTDISDYSLDGYRNRVVYIPQDIFLFSDSIKNNLLMDAENVSDDEFRCVCKLCKVDEFVQCLPMGYDTMLEESGENLSVGQRQRLAIARALLKKPDILIMDEATSNLDSVTENCIQNAIDCLSGDMTCIVIAHRLSTIKNCDCICVMQNGVIAEKGTHKELMSLNGLYARYYNQQ